jgi:hypothetical protein
MEVNMTINLIHYSTKSGLTLLDPKYQGTGSRGEETKRGRPEVTRINFYRANTRTESSIVANANAKYIVKANEDSLYDLATDKDGILNDAYEAWSKMLSRCGSYDDYKLGKLKAAGYKGYFNSSHPSLNNVVALFEAQEPIAEHEIKIEDRTVAVDPT